MMVKTVTRRKIFGNTENIVLKFFQVCNKIVICIKLPAKAFSQHILQIRFLVSRPLNEFLYLVNEADSRYLEKLTSTPEQDRSV